MKRLLATILLLTIDPAQAQSPDRPVNPNMGPVTGQGVLTDSKQISIGTWAIAARLEGGQFSGSGSVTINGATVTMPLEPRRSYLENGKCYFVLVQGRNHISLGGPCTSRAIKGSMSGFLAEGDVFSTTGYMAGSLAFAGPGAAPVGGVPPTSKLTCAWMERIGGIVAGQPFHYELRFSNMGTLTLSPAGAYRTASSSGRFVRIGNDRIKLVSGQFAGAIGRLQPDKSGRPAVYFERDENRTAQDVHIVDPQRTSCTVARGG